MLDERYRPRLRRFVSALPGSMLLLFLCLVLCSCAGQGGKKVPSNPLVLADETLPGGSKIVWDCVYFGEYPTAEVVGTTFSSVDDYALEEGDVICDASLYEKLKSAEWKADEAVIDGARYRRLWAPLDAHARAQHYVWEEGSCHYFKYEPIKWRVLQVAAGTMTLIADRMPDCAPYNTFAGDVYWESCTLRSFLNGYGKDENLAGEDYSANAGDSFLGTAFDENERAALVKGRVENPKNYYFGTYSGEATWDYVYLPDEQEIFLTELALRQGFAKSDGIADCARRFRPTLYAMARGAWYSPVETNLGNGFWLLRTTGYTPSNVNYVCDFGCVYNRGTYVNVSDAGILPLIRVNLGKAEFVDAGTVSSSEILRENAEDDTAEAAANARQPAVSHGYSEPVVVADKTSSSGFRTTWDCLYFGQYPKTEIVAGKFKAVSDYAVDGEVLEDAELFQRLSEAKWTDDETVLEGVKYRRMKAPAGGNIDGSKVRQGRLKDAGTETATEESSDGSGARQGRQEVAGTDTTTVSSLNTTDSQHYRWSDMESYHYFQYAPLKWRVLELSGDTALLLADREPDCAPYHLASADVSWADSTLRSFLNGYSGEENLLGVDYSGKPSDSFFGTAFSKEEAAAILDFAVPGTDNRAYGTTGGRDTVDKVFLLSVDDVFADKEAAARHGFYPGDGVDDPARRFRPTMYAKARGAWYSPVKAYQGNGFWYMRTPGYSPSNVTYICDFGYIYNRGTDVSCSDSGLLPAIRVDLSRLPKGE